MADDETTPKGEPLSAKYRNSFAYTTVKDRLPVILSKIADTLCRMKDQVREEHGEKGCAELKTIIGCMSKLRNEVQTDKPLKRIKDRRSDTNQWNDYLVEAVNSAASDGDGGDGGGGGVGSNDVSWFNERWLYIECYMYRRVQEAVELCDLLKTLDVFQQQKQNSLLSCQSAVDGLLSFLADLLTTLGPSTSDTDLQTAFTQLVQISLWSNKCDLSISGGAEMKYQFSLLDTLETLLDNVLINDTGSMWDLLRRRGHTSGRPPVRVDIILDNFGYELVTDLCLAEFLVASGLAATVRFHGKAFPWFVSDTTPEDFRSVLAQLERSADNDVAARLGEKWQKRLQDGSWCFTVHDFWTLPYTFDQMLSRCPDLYAHLAASDLVIFKGDLNYRKLVGDINWGTTTPFRDALRGFHPAPLCSLRTIKSDTVVGLRHGMEAEMLETDAKWMVNGNWGVISVSEQIS